MGRPTLHLSVTTAHIPRANTATDVVGAADEIAVNAENIHNSNSRKSRSFRAEIRKAGSTPHATVDSFVARRTAISRKPAMHGFLRPS